MSKTIYPEIVVHNHRYRGPMESRKDNSFYEDVFTTIHNLKKLFDTVDKSTVEMEGKIDAMNNEKGAIHKQLFTEEQKLMKLKGGELR